MNRLKYITLLTGGYMYLFTVNINSRVMVCRLSSAHWLQTSKRSALRAFIRFGKIEINAPISTTTIIITMII